MAQAADPLLCSNLVGTGAKQSSAHHLERIATAAPLV